MKKNIFFKPTSLYKEFMILDLIEKNKVITQRVISKSIGVSVSMVNSYLDEYEKNGLIFRNRLTTKTVEYCVTEKGTDRRKLLNIWYLKSSREVYDSSKENICLFLKHTYSLGYKKILLYGGGVVAEIINDVLQNDKTIYMKIVAIVDDSVSEKRISMIEGIMIIPPTDIYNYNHDGILVSSYTHHREIYRNLIKLNYDQNRIIQFF